MSSLIATACIKRSPCPIQVGQPQIARGPRIFRRPCRSSVILGPGDSHPPSGNDYSVTIAWPARKSQLAGKSPPKKWRIVHCKAQLLLGRLGIRWVTSCLTWSNRSNKHIDVFWIYVLLWGYKDWTNMDLVVYTWLLFQPNPMGLPSGILHAQTHTHTHTHTKTSQNVRATKNQQTYKHTSKQARTHAHAHTHTRVCLYNT